MRRKYFIGALLGLLLGFIGQLTVDFFFEPMVQQNRRKHISVFQVICDTQAALSGDERTIRFIDQARPLLLQALFLAWLASRGEVACRTAAITALLFLAAIHTANYRRQKRN